MQGAAAGGRDASYRLASMEDKAGLESVDREHVRQVMLDASRNSRFFHNEQRKEAQLQLRIDAMIAARRALSAKDLASSSPEVERLVRQIEEERDLTQTWIHVDMDAFYVAVELLERPDLARQPVAVGGIGMILTASYEARKYGVRSAMPGYIAKKLCPHLVFIPASHDKYRDVALRVRAVFAEYDADYEALSLDEAVLNVTQHMQRTGATGWAVAAELRARIEAATRVTASAGIACNKVLAKMCSNERKPNGQFELRADAAAVLEYLGEMPVRKIPGVGKVTERVLAGALDVHTCADVFAQRALLARLVTPVQLRFLLSRALGVASAAHPPRRLRKSIGLERTFRSIHTLGESVARLEHLCRRLAAMLADEGVAARTVTLKLKTTDFQVRTRATTLGVPLHSFEELVRIARPMLEREGALALRLMGVRLTGLAWLRGPPREGQQLLAFMGNSSRWTPSGDGAAAAPASRDLLAEDGDVDDADEADDDDTDGAVGDGDADECSDDDDVDDDQDDRAGDGAADSQLGSPRRARPRPLGLHVPPAPRPSPALPTCPVCDRAVPAAQLESHTEACLSSVVSRRKQLAVALSLGAGSLRGPATARTASQTVAAASTKRVRAAASTPVRTLDAFLSPRS